VPAEVLEIAFSRCIALVLATNALVGGAAWLLHSSRVAELRADLEPAKTSVSLLRPSGSVLGPFEGRRACEAVDYAGPATPLYANRPYHTHERVVALEGHRFCRGARHGRGLRLLDVDRATTLYAIASEQHRLEQSGWTLLPETVRVEAAGLPLDRLYRKRIERGRYAVHYGRARTAHPVFWNPRDARIVPVAPPSG
jgi:hypothetical protein